MKKNNEYRRNNENTHMAINNNGKIISHPTLSETQIFEINQQIDNLLKQLNIVEKRYRYSETGWDKLCLESPITLNISYFHEELSRIYESIGKPLDALNALVMASQSLFEGHCYILNSVMGKGEPHEARLEALHGPTKYHLDGARGRIMDVFEDCCVFTTKVSLGSIITKNATDGEKTVYFADCLGVQFKKTGLTIGYLQLETASSTMNNRHNNFFAENTFTFTNCENIDEVVGYIQSRIATYKMGRAERSVQEVTSIVSPIEEIKQYKELLDMGILTQEEFDTKKKQLLGL